MFHDYRRHHVGIIMPSVEDAERHLETFGLVEDYRGYVERWHSLCIFTKPADGAAIELVVADEAPLTRFNHGLGGVHHFAYEIEDFIPVYEWCDRYGFSLLEPQPIKGAGNFLCNFINPLDTRGIQIELVKPL